MAAPIVLVGAPDSTPATDISEYVQFDTITSEDTGNQADDTADFEVLDKALSITGLEPEGRIRITQDGNTRFNGFIQTLEPAWEGLSRRYRVSCVGISHLLDLCIIPPGSGGAYVRSAGETDRARIRWLLNTFGGPFQSAGSSSHAYIQTLDTNMPRQNFANLTLRQAIERVLGAASESANYYVDTLGRLHTWDNNHEETDAAPFDIYTGAPTSTRVPPTGLRVMWDTSELINYYYVRGKNAAGSGPRSDATSIATYGRRQAFIDGPDSDTRKKAKRLGKAALKDTKDPLVRCFFAVEGDYCENGSGAIWQPGQKVSITSPAHNMNGYEIRILRVTTSYLSGAGDRRMEIECGALRANFWGGPDGYGGGTGRYPNPNLVLNWGEPEVDAYPGANFADPGSAIDATPYTLDDFTRTNAPTAVGDLATTSSSDGTSHTIAIPTGSGIAGRLLWVWLSCEYAPTMGTQMDDTMADVGFTPASGFVSSNVTDGRYTRLYSKVTDGTDDTGLAITLSTSSTVLAIAGLTSNASVIDASEALLTAGTYLADPPSLTPAWPSGDSAAWYTIGFSVAELSGDPTGYTNVVDGLTDGTTYVRASVKADDSATEDPSAYTGAASIGEPGGAFTFAISDPSAIKSALTTSSGTSHEFALPDGLQTGDGLLVFMAYTAETAEDLDNEIITPDWPDSSYGQSDSGGSAGQTQLWLWKQLDGTEGFTGSGDTFTIDHDVATNNLYAIAIRIPRIAMLPTEGFPWNAISSWGETPGSTPTWDTWDVTTGYSEWLTTDPCIRFVILSGTGTISDLPSGYTVLSSVDNGTLYFAVAYKDDVSTNGDTPTPDPTLGTGHHVITSFGVRTTGIESGWGQIPQGYGVDHNGPWEGGNTWDTSGAGAAFDLTGTAGTIALSGDDRTAVAILSSDAPDQENDEPWGPWADARAEVLMRWKVNPTGDAADAADNRITIRVLDGLSSNRLYINLGDNVAWSYMDPDQQRGIALATGTSTYSSFVAKTIASDTEYYTRFDFRGETLRAKLWAVSATEPTTWDVTLAREYETGLSELQQLRLDFDGNDGMVLTVTDIKATLGAVAGSSVGRHVIAYGDGSTTTFSTDGQPFTPGSLSVWVDNQPVTPASYDAAAGTFTLASAPYGDPVEAASGSSVIEAAWKAA